MSTRGAKDYRVDGTGWDAGACKVRESVRSSGAVGFTLLEVVIAVSIIAVGFTAVFSLNSQSVSAGRSVEFHSKASLLAAEKLSDIENRSGYTWKASIAGIESEQFGEFADRLKKIDLVISLGDGELTWSMTAYRYFSVEEKL